MRGRWTIAIAVVTALLALLAINAVLVDRKTKEAEITVPGARILRLAGGDLQVAEHGPRGGSPIVLIHCYTCAMDWWDDVAPRLARERRVITLDLLGHGGSEKPGSGYAPEHQAEVVEEALERMGVRGATVVGHSLGGTISTALAEQAPQLVDRVAIVDMPPDDSYGDLGFTAELAFKPLIGQALWALKPDFTVRDGLERAFAPGFEVPDAFVEDVKRMTYTAYDETIDAQGSFLDERSLDRRLAATGKPLMVLMGAEEQIVDDPRRALAQYEGSVPGAETHLVAGAGHSPNVERPRETAALILGFAEGADSAQGVKKAVSSSVRDVTERGSKPQQGPPADVR